MKVIIEQDISFIITYDEPCEDGRETDTAIEIQELCSKFSVGFKFSSTTTEDRFTILAQKITLDEVNMNQFFYTVMFFADYIIRHAWLGGENWDFALRLNPEQK